MHASRLTHLPRRRLFLWSMLLPALLAVGLLLRPAPAGAFASAGAAPRGNAAEDASGVSAVVRNAFRQGQVVGEGPNRAALIVRYGDGSTATRCVAFSEPEIGGDELLQRSGLNPAMAPDGGVCSINGQGCPSNDCFCQCPFPECEYWAYYLRSGDAWQYSQFGAISTLVSHGDLQGWSWGQGDFMQGVEPPPASFEQICGNVPAPDVTPTSPGAPVPMPTTLLLLAGGVAGAAAYAWRMRARARA